MQVSYCPNSVDRARANSRDDSPSSRERTNVKTLPVALSSAKSASDVVPLDIGTLSPMPKVLYWSTKLYVNAPLC
jgi:hypothetical protein